MKLYYNNDEERFYFTDSKDVVEYVFDVTLEHFVMSKASYITDMYEDEDGDEQEHEVEAYPIKHNELFYIVFHLITSDNTIESFVDELVSNRIIKEEQREQYERHYILNRGLYSSAV